MALFRFYSAQGDSAGAAGGGGKDLARAKLEHLQVVGHLRHFLNARFVGCKERREAEGE